MFIENCLYIITRLLYNLLPAAFIPYKTVHITNCQNHTNIIHLVGHISGHWGPN